jgi:hypothetical protein
VPAAFASSHQSNHANQQLNNPLAMEIDSLKLQMNALMIGLNHQSQPHFRPRPNQRPQYQPPNQYHPRPNNQQYSYPYNQSNPSLQPLTPDERAYLMSIKGCFRCRKPGHIMRDCPKNWSSSLHNMALGIPIPDGIPPITPDISGKATSDKV